MQCTALCYRLFVMVTPGIEQHCSLISAPAWDFKVISICLLFVKVAQMEVCFFHLSLLGKKIQQASIVSCYRRQKACLPLQKSCKPHFVCLSPLCLYVECEEEGMSQEGKLGIKCNY